MTEERLMCGRCKEEINQSKDKWVDIMDIEKGKVVSKVSVHIACWKNMHRESMNKAFNEKAKQISPILSGLMGKLGGLPKND